MSETRYRKVKLGPLEVLVCMAAEPLQRARRVLGLREAPGAAGMAQIPTSTARTEAPGRFTTDGDWGARELRARVDALEWYHTIELPHGTVTPGAFDLRPYLPQYPIPERLDGMRILDVATFDGFWAFEFERRGAAEVVAVDVASFTDIDLPPSVRARVTPDDMGPTGQGFQLCRQALGSSVRRETLNVYELSPERLGTFDLVFVGDLLLHLMNPPLALQKIRSVTRGHALIVDVYNPVLPGRLMAYEGGRVQCTWWSMSLKALEQMVSDAGFRQVRTVNRFPTGHRGESPWIWHAAIEAYP